MTIERKGIVGLIAAFAAVLMLSLSASASAASIRVGAAPRPPAGARDIGRLAGGTPLRVTVTLNPRDPLALQAYGAAVSDPSSPLYHHYLTVAQFAQRFGPTDGQLAALRASLRAHGLTPGVPTANHLAVPVLASAQLLARAFSISFRRYALPGGRTAFANAAPPTFDRSVGTYVQGVIGLSTLARPRPLGIRARAVRSGGTVAPRVLTGGPQPCAEAVGAAAQFPGSYTADQIASAYRFSGLYGAGDLGAGQTIALYELEPFNANDVAHYQACYGTATSVTNVPVDGGPPGSGSGEAVLDIEDVVGLAPQARILVYSGPNAATDTPGSGPYDTYAQIINENRAKVISTSWCICEARKGPDVFSENTLFQEAAVQGQTIVAASGDNGAEDCTDANGDPTGGLAVDDPASQPFVTGVGGTALLAPGPPPSETVWNEAARNEGAGGGGISSVWQMPVYQSSASPALGVINGASSGAPCGSATKPCREVPDVSANADPQTGYLVYISAFNGWVPIGGASAAAPTWGALLALANAQHSCGGQPLGFVNPALYRVAGGAYAATFNDVLVGNNALTAAGGFSATHGYDMATGLGTPNGTALATALCDRVTLVNPGNRTTVAGTPVAVSLVASSSSGAQLSYSAIGLPRGLSLNSQTGVISGVPTTVGSSIVTVAATDSLGQASAVTFLWSVVRVAVAVANPGAQSATVGRATRLQIRASANNGHAPTYSAKGLPAGLSINSRTGLISGTPRRTGRYSVAVTASVAGASGSVTFRWRIGQRPRLSSGTVRGIATAPRLAFDLGAGSGSPGIQALELRLPAGLSFASHGGRGITVSGAGGHRLRYRVASAHGVLTCSLSAPTSTVHLVLGSPRSGPAGPWRPAWPAGRCASSSSS